MLIEVQEENPYSEAAGNLIKALSSELGAIYGDDGSAAFTPDDVTVARSAFVVAWHEGKAVGCGALRPMDEFDTAEVKRMFVIKEARGLGISRKILEKLETIAINYDYKRIILETGIYQTEAISLYEKSAYVKTACYGKYVDNPISLCYEKKLN